MFILQPSVKYKEFKFNESILDEGYRPIYVVLTDTGTTFNSLIKMYTGDPYNHVSLSLDLGLESMYSFGQDIDDHHKGFVKESKSKGLLKEKLSNVRYSIYMTFINTNMYDALLEKIKEFEDNINKLKFNVAGVLGFVINRSIEVDNKYFCSQFVDYMFKNLGLNLTNKLSSMVKPYDFAKNKNFIHVDKGYLRNYDQKKVEAKVNDIIASLSDDKKNRMVIFKNKDTINESYMFDKKDFVQNLGSWKKGSNNILYITGHSGSGKSTTASQMAKDNNAIYVELDLFEHNNLIKKDSNDPGDKLIIDYTKSHSININGSLDKLYEEFEKFFKWVNDKARADKNNLYIFEGIQLFEAIEPKFFKNKPLIIKNTSAINSLIRRMKRDGDGKIDWKIQLQNDFPQLLKFYMDNEKRIKDLKKNITETINESSSTKTVYCATISSKLPEKDTIFAWDDYELCKGWLAITISDFAYRKITDFMYYNSVGIGADYTPIIEKKYKSEFIEELKKHSGYIHKVEIPTDKLGYMCDDTAQCKSTDFISSEFEKIDMDDEFIKNYISFRKSKISESLILDEKDLNTADRKALKDSDFGLPDERKYPLIDVEHVRKAIQFFSYCPAEKKKILARNIEKAAKKYDVEISKDGKVYKYLNESIAVDDTNEPVFINLLGKTLDATIDRPLGTEHINSSNHKITYEMNYGYIKGILSSDSEDLDIYIVGLNKKLNIDDIIKVKIIALIQRFEGEGLEEKLIGKLYTDNKEYTESEIETAINFAEKFYKHKLHMNTSTNLNEGKITDKLNLDIKLDADGAIIIKKQESADFMQLYSQSHKLLQQYEISKNYEGMKYELSKLWFINNIIETKVMYRKGILSKLVTEEKRKESIKARAFIMNDFKKYLKIIIDNDSTFNFYKYYEATPFYTETLKIDKSTIKGLKELIKTIVF